MTTPLGNNTSPPTQPISQGGFSDSQNWDSSCPSKKIWEVVKEALRVLVNAGLEILTILSRSFYYGMGFAVGAVIGLSYLPNVASVFGRVAG
jgi:hypothetical protein